MPVRVQPEDFEVAGEIERLRAGQRDVGAVVSFIGVVRDFNDEAPICELTLEHYPGMTERALAAIVAAAKSRWAIHDALVIHRVGALSPADRIVFVAVAAAHRREAFAACEFVIDALKTRAPFWKKEHTADGVRWVEQRIADVEAECRRRAPC